MKINFGIIGCGHIAKRHAHHILHTPKANLVGCYDSDPQRAAEFCEENELDVSISDSLSQLLENKELDIVNICTPNGTHKAIAIQALAADKHVLVEKPMALSSADCNAMIKAAHQANRSLFVVKQNRFNPPVQWLKKSMEKEMFGKLMQVSINCFWNRNEHYYSQADWRGSKNLDGGILFTQFSHFIDILFYLAGEVQTVSGVSRNFLHPYTEIEDAAHFSFQLKSGAIGSLAATVNAYQKNVEGSITLFFENATIKIGGKYLNTLEFVNAEKMEKLPKIAVEAANDYGNYEGSMSNHDKVINNVVKALNGEEPIMTSAEEGAKVVQMIEQFYKGLA